MLQELSMNSVQLPTRASDSHKGDFGHVLVVAGDVGMGGAARMASEAALRVGAGLCSLATHSEHAAFVSAVRPEIMSHGIKTQNDLKKLLEKATVVVIGPGLVMGQNWSDMVMEFIFAKAKVPMIVDAGALDFIKDKKSNNWILTPHPGEAARLLDLNAAKIQSNREEFIKKLQKTYSGVVVLKGAGTLIADDADVFICPYGNPGMASGGMGDVLAGMIAGLFAQKLSLIDAAKLGVCMHAKAGDKAAKKLGQRYMLAMDLLAALK